MDENDKNIENTWIQFCILYDNFSPAESFRNEMNWLFNLFQKLPLIMVNGSIIIKYSQLNKTNIKIITFHSSTFHHITDLNFIILSDGHRSDSILGSEFL